MNEIRFSPPAREGASGVPKDNTGDKKPRVKFNGLFRFLIKILGVFAVLLIVFWVVRYFDPMKNINSSGDAFSAVFLSNGQVYFGKIERNDSFEMVLKNVYYLQINENNSTQGALNQTHFNLVKLGQELHGPKDELFINKSQVVFYEYLRDDSKVVESIKNFK